METRWSVSGRAKCEWSRAAGAQGAVLLMGEASVFSYVLQPQWVTAASRWKDPVGGCPCFAASPVVFCKLEILDG